MGGKRREQRWVKLGFSDLSNHLARAAWRNQDHTGAGGKSSGAPAKTGGLVQGKD